MLQKTVIALLAVASDVMGASSAAGLSKQVSLEFVHRDASKVHGFD
jgi:hypothetical protein